MSDTVPAPQKDDAVARAAAVVEREDADARKAFARPVRARRGLEIAVGVLAVANILGWVVFPPRGPDATDPRTPDAIERDLRLTIGAAADEVEAWRLSHGGALPDAMPADAAATDSTLRYTRIDSVTFEVSGSTGSGRLSYRSGTPLADFVAGPAPSGVRP